MSLHHWIVPLLWLAAVSSVAGQTTDVTQCISSYGFVFIFPITAFYIIWLIVVFCDKRQSINALGQNPCLVAAFLESACGTRTFSLHFLSGESTMAFYLATNIPAIPDVPGDHYLGPNATEADPCRCSSVTYSMISACAGCQNRTYTDWLTWNENCPEVSFTTWEFILIWKITFHELHFSRFPESLPPSVKVPSWAYLDITLVNRSHNRAYRNLKLISVHRQIITSAQKLQSKVSRSKFRY